MDSQEGLRLRLMALLSLYDLLPYSISNPPHGRAPMSLEEAIGPDAVRRCLDVITRQHPSSVALELSNILRNSSRSNNNSSGSSRSPHGAAHGQTHSGNAYYANYSNSPAQSHYLRNGN